MTHPRFVRKTAGGFKLTCAYSSRLTAVALVTLFWFPLPARALCSVVPRVCTEFFRSAAVLTGTVVSERDWSSDTDFIERTYYKLKVEGVYRGETHEFIEVYTENNSGRLKLEVGKGYLLFASAGVGGLLIGCGGNSAELKDASETMREIKRLLAGMQSAHGGDIGGLVRFSDAEPDKGVAGVEIVVKGNGHTYVARTNSDGRFHVHVPAGQYVAHVNSAKWTARTDDYSNDRAESIKVENGGCADVTFLASPNRPSTIGLSGGER